MPPYFSVIVPTYNRSFELEKCLEALSACRRDDAEIVVVDDCSTSDNRTIAERFGALCFSPAKRGGPAAARNLGVKHAKGQIIVFVDGDVLVRPDLLNIISEEFENHPELAALFGSYDDAPAHTDFCSSFKNLLHHYVHQASREEASTFWTGCGAIRKPIFEALGGFNTDLYSKPSIEDIELGIRLTQQGQKIRLVKRLQVKHLKSWTARSIVETDFFRRALPWTQLIIRTGNIPKELNLSWSSRISAALVGCWLALAAAVCVGAIGRWSWFPQSMLIAMIIVMAVLFVLNRRLYRFFFRKRGMKFASQAILGHWFYLLYSGLAFVSCCILELSRIGFRSLVRSVGFGTIQAKAPLFRPSAGKTRNSCDE